MKFWTLMGLGLDVGDSGLARCVRFMWGLHRENDLYFYIDITWGLRWPLLPSG